MSEVLAAIEEITGHGFGDLSLLMSALTHPSYAHEHPGEADYQRLEFLGDSAVGLTVTRRLYERFPDVPEGDLSDLRQQVVNTRALGRVGRAMGLTPWVRLGVSEASKRVIQIRILGDVVEALYGALMVEAGLDACQVVTDRWLAPLLDALRDEHAADAVKNPVNRLQELTQADGGAAPAYRYTHEGPAHDLTWHAIIALHGEDIATGTGASKKAATKAAASLALGILQHRAVAS